MVIHESGLVPEPVCLFCHRTDIKKDFQLILMKFESSYIDSLHLQQCINLQMMGPAFKNRMFL